MTNSDDVRKYRFIFRCFNERFPEIAEPDEHLYVEVSDVDVVEATSNPDIKPTEADYLSAAMGRMEKLYQSTGLGNGLDSTLKAIEMVPVDIPASKRTKTIEEIIAKYDSSADSMSELIAAHIRSPFARPITNKEVQYLIEYVGDENHVNIDDIRHMADEESEQEEIKARVLKERKYCFTYGYANPDVHSEYPDHENKFYVQLSDSEVIGEGYHPTEEGFLAAAMDHFNEERESMEYNETEKYELRSITVVPITKTVENPSDTVKRLMEEYMSNADSMTDVILSWLAEDDSHTLTDEEIQTLIKFAGDDDYVTVESIRSMATNDAVYNVEPYKSMRAMLDVMKELDVGSSHFTERMRDVDNRITADAACLNEATTKGEIDCYVRRINQLKKYRGILRLIKHIDHLESIVGGRIDLAITDYGEGTPNVMLVKAED